MRSRGVRWLALSFLLLPLLAIGAYADSITLGTAGSYAVLAGSTVTNTGPSVLNGNLGVSPGSAVTGFPPGMVNGTINMANGPAAQAQSDLTAAYVKAAGLASTGTLTGQDLGGKVLTPGVYFLASSAQLTGTLTLNAQGNPNALFVFQIGSALTTASNSAVVFTNGLVDKNVFWQVGSSATLGTGTAFAGNILALTSITMNTGAGISCGSALARNGAVTLDNNVIGGGCGGGGGGGGATVPEPGTISLMGSGLILLAGVARRRLRM
jgi:Ice-binding-like/PEP-CTERM motif